jgi:hypothetical protein
VRVRDSAPASVISGCDFSFPRTGFVSRWSFRSQARHARSSINKAEVFIFFSAPLALVSVSVSAPFWFSRHDFSSALFFLSGSAATSAGSDLLVELFVL